MLFLSTLKTKEYFQIQLKIPNQQIPQKYVQWQPCCFMLTTEKQSKQLFLANCCTNMPKKYIFLPALSFILISNFLYNLEEVFFYTFSTKMKTQPFPSLAMTGINVQLARC